MAENEEQEAVTEATKAGELAQSNIARFLKLQAERNAALIMKAHEQNIALAAEAAGTAAELAAINIRRFLELQASRMKSLIMRAHQGSPEIEKK